MSYEDELILKLLTLIVGVIMLVGISSTIIQILNYRDFKRDRYYGKNRGKNGNKQRNRKNE